MEGWREEEMDGVGFPKDYKTVWNEARTDKGRIRGRKSRFKIYVGDIISHFL